MGREGVEPSQCHHRRILSPLRLPIPPSPRHAGILPYFEMLSNREALSLFIIYLLRQSLMMNGM